MSEDNGICCNVCGAVLRSEREQHIHICIECRRYGLLNGCWPVQESSKPADAAAVDSVAVDAS